MSKSDDQSNNNQYQQRIIDLNVNGHLMSLDTGLYCIYHVANQIPADEFGLPGLRISVPPFKQNATVEIKTFENDGWLGAEKNAVLVRISGDAGLVLVTVYRNPSNNYPAPQLQVIRLNDASENDNSNNLTNGLGNQNSGINEKIARQSKRAVAQQQNEIEKEGKMRVVAHVQRLGDVSVELGDWIGIPDSKTWIEGFGLSLDDRIQPEDIEYQAVLGKGWFSPWYKGNEFCGSRGMSLPLCGLRVRLNGDAAKKYTLSVEATFIDGTKLGPVDDDTILSSETIAPLEAFSLDLIDHDKGKNSKEAPETRVSSSNVKSIKPRTNIKVKNAKHKSLSNQKKTES